MQYSSLAHIEAFPGDAMVGKIVALHYVGVADAWLKPATNRAIQAKLHDYLPVYFTVVHFTTWRPQLVRRIGTLDRGFGLHRSPVPIDFRQRSGLVSGSGAVQGCSTLQGHMSVQVFGQLLQFHPAVWPVQLPCRRPWP